MKPIPSRGSDKMFILLLGTQMAGGGAQKVLLDQADWFHAHGHKVTAAFFYDRDGLCQKWQSAHDFPILELKAFQPGAGMVRNAFSLLKGLLALWRLIRREKFDAIETFTHDSNLLGLPVAWLGGIPVRVATHHGMIENWGYWRKKLHAWLVNHKIASVLVTVSEMTRQKALEEGVHSDRISVIKNGIAPISIEGVNGLKVRREFGVGEDDLFLLSVGRLVFQKAHEILVAAIPAVLREFPNVKVGICGDGYLRSRLQAQIESLGIADSIQLLGQFDNVVRFLASADVFIMPSRWEGLPIALLEAMSAGLPVIATRVEGMEEVIQDSENGLLVPAEDPGALSGAILRLLHDPAARSRMGLAARQCIKTSYTLDRMCEQYLEVIRQPRIERNS